MESNKTDIGRCGEVTERAVATEATGEGRWLAREEN